MKACRRCFVCVLQCLAILVKLDLKLCHTKKNQAKRDPGAKADAPEVFLNFIRVLFRWHHEAAAPFWKIFENFSYFYTAFLKCIIRLIHLVVVVVVDTGGASLTLWKIDFYIFLAKVFFLRHILQLKTVLKRGWALLSASKAFLEEVQFRIIRPKFFHLGN